MSSKKEKILGESERQLVNEGLFYESMVNPRDDPRMKGNERTRKRSKGKCQR